ncbi:MAG TPA: hypothetical protein VII66_00985 [Gemmatimonadaceae bacterium]
MSERVLLAALLADIKRVAQRYYQLTGRPLGVTGEVAEMEAVRLLRLRPATVRQPGYDAEGPMREGRRVRFQIKGRCMVDKVKATARLGAIDLSKPWDAVLLVLMDADFATTAIYRAERAAVEAALTAPGSKARNERGQLSISKFRAIGIQVWPRAGTDRLGMRT